MSRYDTKPTQFGFKAQLVKALEEVYGCGNVEVHEKAKHLYGYHGDERREVANIIVRREHVGPAANDLGFVLGSDNKYKMIISEYDQGSNNRTQQIMEKYLGHVVKDKYSTKYKITGTENGKIHLKLRGAL